MTRFWQLYLSKKLAIERFKRKHHYRPNILRNGKVLKKAVRKEKMSRFLLRKQQTRKVSTSLSTITSADEGQIKSSTGRSVLNPTSFFATKRKMMQHNPSITLSNLHPANGGASSSITVLPPVPSNNNNNNQSQTTTHRIESDGNHIWFYADVSRDRILTLVQYIQKLNFEIASQQERLGQCSCGDRDDASSRQKKDHPSNKGSTFQQQQQRAKLSFQTVPRKPIPKCSPRIFLHINSYGGDVSAAFLAVDAIVASRYPVVSIVEGNAASAATLISSAAHWRQMNRHSFMMIHEISSSFSCRFSELPNHTAHLSTEMKHLKQLYKRNSHLSKTDLDFYLEKDIWWTANECLSVGMIDEVV